MDKKLNSKSNKIKNNKTSSTSEDCNIRLSNKLMNEGINFFLENNHTDGIQYLSKAILLNSNNPQLYLNRCYGYLIMKKYILALADAEHDAVTKCKIPKYVFIGKLRAAQASLALQKYLQAQMYLKKALLIEPCSLPARRELIRVKVAFMVNMGYNEKDALLALELYPETLEALKFLSDNNFAVRAYQNSFKTIANSDYDDLVYSSDADEKPTNIEIVNRILNNEPEIIKRKDTSKIAKASSSLSISNDKNKSTKMSINKSVNYNSNYDSTNTMAQTSPKLFYAKTPHPSPKSQLSRSSQPRN